MRRRNTASLFDHLPETALFAPDAISRRLGPFERIVFAPVTSAQWTEGGSILVTINDYS